MKSLRDDYCFLEDVNQLSGMSGERTVSISSLNKAEIDIQMLSSWSMKQASHEIKKLRAKAKASFPKTAELQQVLAQVEANLARTENQKVSIKLC